MPWVLDLHVHTILGSADSLLDPEELIIAARRCGLDGACLTEHGHRRLSGVEELARKRGFLLIPAIEATTELGDILIFGIESYPREVYRAGELRQFVEKAGGVMVAAHPFRNDLSPRPRSSQKFTLEEACRRPLFRLVDALEVANGWASQEDVDFAFSVGEKLGLPGTGGSDAHSVPEVGSCVTIFEEPIRGQADLVRALREGRFQAQDRRPEERKRALFNY